LRSDNVHRRRQLARGARAGGGPVPWQVELPLFPVIWLCWSQGVRRSAGRPPRVRSYYAGDRLERLTICRGWGSTAGGSNRQGGRRRRMRQRPTRSSAR